MSLRKYKKKRNFSRTPEPTPKKTKKSSGKKLYIIQKHDASHLHYDLRLELDGVLLSWAVPKGPCLDPTVKRLAMHVEDHPVEYGSFEGIIPQGQYGGGTVMLWDRGEWISLEKNTREAYRSGKLSFVLKGKKLKGRWKLIRMHKDDKTWLLIKVKDEYARSLKDYDIEAMEPDSVKSGMTLDEIAEKYGQPSKKKKNTFKRSSIKQLLSDIKPSRLITSVSPALATLVDEPPTDKNWLHEIKFDGYRIIAIKKNGTTRLCTRNQHDWTEKFSSIANVIDSLPIKTMVLDGEIVVLDEQQHSNFQLLQNAIKRQKMNFIYYSFDLLYVDQFNITELPLIERKKILAAIIPENHDTIRFSDHIIGQGNRLFTKACKLGLEGIISKEIDSPYTQRRTHDWLKVKCSHRQEFIIAGYTAPKNKRSYFGALLLATYDKHKQLNYCGLVGTGFTETSLETIYKKLQKIEVSRSPFKKTGSRK